MSLRYTGEATMDEPALRDVDRWKDKIEVRLDNRQVFFLFFGSAMVACMLFVLGVIVGKRLESRGRAEAPVVDDPLAVLDRFGAVASPAPAPAALTFPRALIGGGPTKNRLAPERLERADKVERLETAPAERLAVTKPTLTATAPVSLALPATPAAPEDMAPAAAALPRPLVQNKAAVTTKTAHPSSVPPAPLTKKLAILPRPVPAPLKAAVKDTMPPAKGAVSAPTASKATPVPSSGKGRFLLQLSSFQDRGEADAFARRFAGQNAYVVATEIPGKGTWYRVRVGSYGTMQEAAVAKTNFERDHNVIAYVAGTGPAK